MTIFKCIKGCYKGLERNLSFVLLMGRARYSSFKHGKSHFNVKDQQYWNRFA